MEMINEQACETAFEGSSEFVISESFKTKEKYPDEFYESYIEGFTPNTKRRLFYRFVKRAFDIFASLTLLLIASPVFLILAIAIACDSKGGIKIGRAHV